MDYFSIDFFIGELKVNFSHKVGRLSIALRAANWQIDIRYLNGDDPDIGKEVDSLEKNAFKRVEFERKQYRMLCDDEDPIQERVNKMIYLSAINWYLGLCIVASDWRDGVKMLLKSTELLDMCHGIIEHEIWQQIETEKKGRAINGGTAKAAIYAPLKAEIIRLLYCKRPIDGWKSKKEALRAIDEDIYKFIQKHGYPVSPDAKKKEQGEFYSRIPRLIEDWSRDDAIIKVVFDSTVKHKKSAPKDAEQNR